MPEHWLRAERVLLTLSKFAPEPRQNTRTAKAEQRISLHRRLLPGGKPPLISAPLGGYLICHGAGDVTALYHFGARSATAPVVIGLVFIAVGVVFGDCAKQSCLVLGAPSLI